MRLTNRSEYALLALTCLGRKYGTGLTTADEISREQSIPLSFLEQILLILKRGGVLRSVKGAKGGFELAKPPSDISLAEVVRLFEGALAPTGSASKHFYELTPVAQEKKLVKVFRQVRDAVAERMEGTSLQEVL